MGTVRGGKLECDKCGSECTALYGFAMAIDRVANTHNEAVKKIVSEIDAKYGKHDFLLCWGCTIQMMGIKTLEQKKMTKVAEAKKTKTETQNQEGK